MMAPLQVMQSVPLATEEDTVMVPVESPAGAGDAATGMYHISRLPHQPLRWGYMLPRRPNLGENPLPLSRPFRNARTACWTPSNRSPAAGGPRGPACTWHI